MRKRHDISVLCQATKFEKIDTKNDSKTLKMTQRTTQKGDLTPKPKLNNVLIIGNQQERSSGRRCRTKLNRLNKRRQFIQHVIQAIVQPKSIFSKLAEWGQNNPQTGSFHKIKHVQDQYANQKWANHKII